MILSGRWRRRRRQSRGCLSSWWSWRCRPPTVRRTNRSPWELPSSTTWTRASPSPGNFAFFSASDLQLPSLLSSSFPSLDLIYLGVHIYVSFLVWNEGVVLICRKSDGGGRGPDPARTSDIFLVSLACCCRSDYSQLLNSVLIHPSPPPPPIQLPAGKTLLCLL